MFLGNKRRRAIRFTEWIDKLNKQQARLNDLALSEVSETIAANGQIISVTIGKGKYEATVDGSDCAARFLRPLYTNNKEEFDAMLESITQATDQVVEATEVILAVISDEAIPQAVIDRMKGEKTSGEPADLVESMTEKRLKELLTCVYEELGGFKKVPATLFNQFQVYLAPIADKPLMVDYHSGLALHIGWGRTSIHSRAGVTIPDVEEAMYFLANYDLIKERILRFIEQIRAIK